MKQRRREEKNPAMSTKNQVSPWQSILAGGAAGGVESLLTVWIPGQHKLNLLNQLIIFLQYPTEYLKTRQQLFQAGSGARQSPLRLLTSTIRQHGISQLYTGSLAFCASNASKSGVRFVTFDTALRFMPTDNSSGKTKTTLLGNLGAGLLAGIAESVLVVTPGETLKTKIIDDRAGPRLYRSASHAIRTCFAQEGLLGLYRGVVPVTLKQSANAMVRFTSYRFFLGQMDTMLVNDSNSTFRSMKTVVAGALAGLVTVYATIPFDAVKTRLQALDGRQRYRGSWNCLLSVIRNEGTFTLWRGTTPRLARLSVGLPYLLVWWCLIICTDIIFRFLVLSASLFMSILFSGPR